MMYIWGHRSSWQAVTSKHDIFKSSGADLIWNAEAVVMRTLTEKDYYIIFCVKCDKVELSRLPIHNPPGIGLKAWLSGEDKHRHKINFDAKLAIASLNTRYTIEVYF